MLGIESAESQDPLHGAGAVRRLGAAIRRRRLVWTAVALAAVCLLGLRVFDALGPKPCTSCHSRADFRAATQASAHAQVDCRSCHMASGMMGEVLFALQQPLHTYSRQSRAADRDAAEVPDTRCKTCHEVSLRGVVGSGGIRMDHAWCAVGASCTDCHSSVAHGTANQWIRSYDMDRCLGCHMESGNVQCDLCHQGRDATARIKSSTFAVTHGPKWRSTHGMGSIATCNVCHSSSDCADCHGVGVPHEPSFIDEHSSFAAHEDARCASCHADSFCDGCHGIQMPHPARFTPRHSTAAKRQPKSCTRCHAASDCTDCHEKHVHPGGAIGSAGSAGGGQ